jgi:hypothetical protein
VSNPVVFCLRLRCSCGCRFSALSWAARVATYVGCPWCGRVWAVPAARFVAAGRPFPWRPGSLPVLPAPSVPVPAPAPAVQLSMFDTFSGTAQATRIEPVTPRAVQRITFAKCPVCYDVGKVGDVYCWCEAGTIRQTDNSED